MAVLQKWAQRRYVASSKTPYGNISPTYPPFFDPSTMKSVFVVTPGGSYALRQPRSGTLYASAAFSTSCASFVYGGYLYVLEYSAATKMRFRKFSFSDWSQATCAVQDEGNTIVTTCLAFDGSDYAYVACLSSSATPEASPLDILSYRISTDTWALLSFEDPFPGKSLRGIGLSGSTIYFAYYRSGTYYLISVTTGGASRTVIDSGTPELVVGYKGFNYKASAPGVLYDAGRVNSWSIGAPTCVFILDDEATPKFFMTGGGYNEYEGSTLKFTTATADVWAPIAHSGRIFPVKTGGIVDYSGDGLILGSTNGVTEAAPRNKEIT